MKKSPIKNKAAVAASSSGSTMQLQTIRTGRGSKDSLLRLRNLLKLPKARRWIVCEFFYSEIDKQLLLGESDFQQCLYSVFPNLRAQKLTRTEWRHIRRLLGKPRRCSETFFNEERVALERKRNKIRSIYQSVLTNLDTDDDTDLPAKIPEPLTVGSQVLARIKGNKDGLFPGKIINVNV